MCNEKICSHIYKDSKDKAVWRYVAADGKRKSKKISKHDLLHVVFRLISILLMIIS